MRSFIPGTLALIAVIALGGDAPLTAAHTGAPRVKRDAELSRLAKAGGAGLVRVIVTSAPDGDEKVRARLARRGHGILREHPSIRALTVDVSASELDELTDDPAVENVSIDARVRGATTYVPLLSENTLLSTLGLPDATLTGDGVGVAVVDSGIMASPDLPVTAFYDFTRGGVSVRPYDDYGHGTHVAGLIADTQRRADSRYHSLARRARLIGLKALEADGSGYTSTVIQAIEFATANRRKLGIDVLNLSLGHPILEPARFDPLVRAVEEAAAAGIVVVVAAGNLGANPDTGETGYGGITSPGNAPSAITVGAVDTRNTVTRGDDGIAPFSSRGPTWYDAFAKPDVVAPGRRIVSAMAVGSTLYDEYPEYRVDVGSRSYMALSGTSMATAVTSGVVALMIEASRRTNLRRESLSPYAIKAVLEYTALSLPEEDTLTQGAGSINPAGAIALARAIDPTGRPREWWLTVPVETTTTLGDEVLTWSQRIVWGNRVVWGNAVYTNEDAWAQRAVWGSASRVVWGSAGRVVWGNSVVWGNGLESEEDEVWSNRVVWGSRVVWGTAVLGCTDDDRVVWGSTGELSEDRVVWGSLSSVSSSSAGGLSLRQIQ